MKTLCVIPVYNEYNKLNTLIDQIKKNSFQVFNLQYLFINNGSTDNSDILLKKSGIKYLNIKKNKGVGYALMMGFFYAEKYKFDYLIHLAGNGKMNPAQIDRFINLITQDGYDFVSGSRFLKGSSRKNNPLIRLFLIKSFSLILSLFLKKKLAIPLVALEHSKQKYLKILKKIFLKKNFSLMDMNTLVMGK